MINLQDMLQAVDQLLPEELRKLSDYVRQREAQLIPMLPVEERIRLMDEAAHVIRAGFSEAEWAQIERDMNEEYIEPWDESEWEA